MGCAKQKEHEIKHSAASCQRLDKLLAKNKNVDAEVYEIDSVEESETLTSSTPTKPSDSCSYRFCRYTSSEQLSSVIGI